MSFSRNEATRGTAPPKPTKENARDPAKDSRAFWSVNVSILADRRHTAPAVAPKWKRVAQALLDGPRTSRELEGDPVFDHVAHSTIARLRGLGIEISTTMVEIRAFADLPARIAKYSLTTVGRETARRLLARP